VAPNLPGRQTAENKQRPLPPPTMSALCLPTPLLLLVHLHILEYTHANNAEYDHNVFNPRTRGLRERTKTMEDVAYFLVKKIEGKGIKAVRVDIFIAVVVMTRLSHMMIRFYQHTPAPNPQKPSPFELR
jgi:hypothetical protein